jgi:hypothetical protein
MCLIKEITLDALLAEPIVRLMMAADGVDPMMLGAPIKRMNRLRRQRLASILRANDQRNCVPYRLSAGDRSGDPS